MLSLVWLAILECPEINLFKIEILTPCNLLIFSPLPLFSALSFQILCALHNVLLKIYFYDSPYKWVLLCYPSLSYTLLVLIMSPLVNSVAKYPRYLKQDRWEHKNSMEKVKWSERKCFHTQVWLAFYWFFPSRKIMFKAPCLLSFISSVKKLASWVIPHKELLLWVYCLWAAGTISSVHAVSSVYRASAVLLLEACYEQ